MRRLGSGSPTAGRFFVTACLALVLAACMPAPSTTSPGVSPELKHSWEVSFNRGDASAVAALYAPDAQLVMSGAAPIRGVANIERAIEDMIKSGVKVRIDAEQNIGAGDIGYVYGTYIVRRGEGGPETERGAYVEIWRRRNGAWKIDLDVNASGAPLEGHKD
jgi:ketosteroid isomerase-like protein